MPLKIENVILPSGRVESVLIDTETKETIDKGSLTEMARMRREIERREKTDEEQNHESVR
jgi:hypothetical protein